jgi:hypothetical protein
VSVVVAQLPQKLKTYVCPLALFRRGKGKRFSLLLMGVMAAALEVAGSAARTSQPAGRLARAGTQVLKAFPTSSKPT